MGIFKDFNITFSTQIFIILSGVINNIIITRTIGAVGQGIYTLGITTASILVLFSSFGLIGSNTYLAKRNPKDIQKIYSNSLIFTVIIYAILFSAYLFTRGRPLDYFLPQNIGFIIILVTPALVILELNLGMMWGLEEINRYNLITIFKTAGIVLINIIILIIFRLNVKEVILGWAFVIFLTAILSFYNLKSYVRLSKLKFNVAVFLNSIKIGLRSFLINVFWRVFLKIDLYLIKYFLTFSDVGYYTIAMLILEISNLAPDSIGRLMFNKAVLEDIKSISQISRIGRINILYSILICIGLLLFGKQLIIILFGKNFTQSFNCLLFLLPAIFARNINIVCSHYISGKEAISPFLIYTAILSLALSVGLNIKLIPIMGIQGAAITASLVAILQAVLSLIYFMYITKISFFEFIILKKEDILLLKNKLFFYRSKSSF